MVAHVPTALNGENCQTCSWIPGFRPESSPSAPRGALGGCRLGRALGKTPGQQMWQESPRGSGRRFLPHRVHWTEIIAENSDLGCTSFRVVPDGTKLPMSVVAEGVERARIRFRSVSSRTHSHAASQTSKAVTDIGGFVPSLPSRALQMWPRGEDGALARVRLGRCGSLAAE